ncbi:energy transducer TonB [Pseudomonas sp. ICMP 8385]|uniref:TonB-dependent receptor n=1 Tax=Pseudomonas gessardii TaxID=78544 RepID=A0A7Y1MVC5_9PSED|nr:MULTISPECIES: TonB-dependent receptor [Pseudomonas]MCF4980858.1 TonB-dependent receptor plug domain-containing protein [Pseudomonas gessardii]MCF4991203.1 TonB-dependent receptor plug domain-containing protein [Pseudomonas gessardii]MCF5086125.1 TonB-dependent receptor plug domain-containing protein [Pseudomonas gessardii]MCF5097667.1 TonB-dependent receptor plug domain-containing protein [Pseudomonas gessardii]MCF5109482.1 TonB-dependent receptor plug domain-containing protein [Pseudomonas
MNFKKTTMAAVGSAICLCNGAWAAEPASALEIAPITVTGEKINRTLEQTQSSVVVVTEQQLRDKQDRDLVDVLARTPGVYNQSGNENWGIRGVPVSGFDDQGPATLNGAVSVFVDGAVQPNRALTLSPMPLWDVDQVEVFLGPQSTTQGRNSLAGAVVIQTRNPTFEPSFAARTNMGNYGERGAAVAGGGALVADKIAGRIAVDYQEGDGYIDNVALHDDANPTRTGNARGKLLILPNDDLDVLLTYAHGESRKGDNSAMRQNDKIRYYKMTSNTKAYDKLEQDTLSAKVDYRLDDNWSLTSLTANTRSDYDARLDFDQSADANQVVLRTQDGDLFSQELRLNYSGDTVKSFVGAYYGHNTNNFHDRLLFDNVLFGTAKGETTLESKAVFGEINWTFAPRWTLITGLRYDHETNDTDIKQDDFSSPGKVSKSFDALLPKLGLDFELAANQYLGVMVQKGYRGGGVNVRAGGGHEGYDPEYTTNYELSYRGSFFDKTLRTRANLYYTDWKDQQVSVLERNTDFVQVFNAGSSDIKGLEVFVEKDLGEQLTLTAGGSITAGKYKDFVTGDGRDMSGEAFLYSPKYKLSLGGLYRWNDRLTLNTDLVYQSTAPSEYEFDTAGKVTGERRSDNYWLVNFNTEYKVTRNVAVSGFVKNAFDKAYITNNRSGDIVDVGAPRTVGLVLRYDM